MCKKDALFQVIEDMSQTCEESFSIITVDTSFTFAQYCVCPQSSSLSTDHMRKHDDSTHASAWLKVTLKRDICCTRVRSTLVIICHGSGA